MLMIACSERAESVIFYRDPRYLGNYDRRLASSSRPAHREKTKEICVKHSCTNYPERCQPRLKTDFASTTQLLNVISHRCALGAIRKKFSNSMLSGVVLAASLTPFNSLNMNATAYLSSIRARWIPIHDRAPAPKGWKAVFAAGERASAG